MERLNRFLAGNGANAAGSGADLQRSGRQDADFTASARPAATTRRALPGRRPSIGANANTNTRARTEDSSQGSLSDLITLATTAYGWFQAYERQYHVQAESRQQRAARYSQEPRAVAADLRNAAKLPEPDRREAVFMIGTALQDIHIVPDRHDDARRDKQSCAQEHRQALGAFLQAAQDYELTPDEALTADLAVSRARMNDPGLPANPFARNRGFAAAHVLASKNDCVEASIELLRNAPTMPTFKTIGKGESRHNLYGGLLNQTYRYARAAQTGAPNRISQAERAAFTTQSERLAANLHVLTKAMQVAQKRYDEESTGA